MPSLSVALLLGTLLVVSHAQLPPPGAGTLNALYYLHSNQCSDNNVTDTLINVPSGFCDGTGNARSAFYACDTVAPGNVLVYAYSKIGNCSDTPIAIYNQTGPFCYSDKHGGVELMCTPVPTSVDDGVGSFRAVRYLSNDCTGTDDGVALDYVSSGSYCDNTSPPGSYLYTCNAAEQVVVFQWSTNVGCSGNPDQLMQVGWPGKKLCMTGTVTDPGSLLLDCSQDPGPWYQRPRYIALTIMAGVLFLAFLMCCGCRAYHGSCGYGKSGGTAADDELMAVSSTGYTNL